MKETIIKFLNDVIAEAGGIALVSLILIKFFGRKIVDAVASKYEQVLTKQLELYKSNLNDKEHISKTRFDKEFEIYLELSQKNLTLVYDVGEMTLTARAIAENSPEITEKEIEEIMEKTCNALNEADFSNKQYAPFIDKDVYEDYHKLSELGEEIFQLFKRYTSKDPDFQSEFVFTYHGEEYRSKQDFLNAINCKQKQLSKLSDEILDRLRNYLKSLDVKE